MSRGEVIVPWSFEKGLLCLWGRHSSMVVWKGFTVSRGEDMVPWSFENGLLCLGGRHSSMVI